MGLFGMSSEGKDARKNLEGIAGSLNGNGGEMAGRSGQADDLADFYRPMLEQLFKNLYETGWTPDASPGNFTSLGGAALPSIQKALDQGSARWNDIVDPAFRGIVSADHTADARRPYLDHAGEQVRSNYDANGNVIRDSAVTMSGRNNDASGTILRSVDGTRDELTADSNNTLGGIQGFNGNNFDTLSNAASDWYGGMQKKVGTLLDFDNAASARSAAPARAAAARRLRASGISPDSLEADSIMGRVESARARAFDDNRAGNIGKQNDLRREEFGIGSDLLQKKMANSEGLERDKLATRLSLAKDASEKTQAETLRRTLYDNGVTKDESALTLGNNNRYYDQQKEFDQLMADEAVGTRDRQIQDWQNAGAHAQAGAAKDANDVALEGQRLNTGQGIYEGQMKQYMTGVNGLQGMWAGEQNYALGNNGQAQAGWAGAAQPYQNIYQNEAANSNWLGKGLVGLGTAAVGAFAGGAGAGAGKKWFGK